MTRSEDAQAGHLPPAIPVWLAAGCPQYDAHASISVRPDSWKRPFYPPLQPGALAAVPFLNSGLYLGRAGDILYYLLRYFLEMAQSTQPEFDDQRFWTDIYLSHAYASPAMKSEEPSIGLDTTGRLFQMLNPPREGGAWLNDTWTWKHDLKTNRVYTTNGPYQRPTCALHGPGRKHDFHDILYKRWAAGEEVMYSEALLAVYEAQREQQKPG
ncbi:hypothetical protein WJX72_005898 [[Myrmecia] bisecta]|uniref:PLOD1-3-like GT domain-containing protein n=1 Tax=[Myrmecia] bisecta TaxID=41462 RepID=A0AAW1PVX7_9CHLO